MSDRPFPVFRVFSSTNKLEFIWRQPGPFELYTRTFTP